MEGGCKQQSATTYGQCGAWPMHRTMGSFAAWSHSSTRGSVNSIVSTDVERHDQLSTYDVNTAPAGRKNRSAAMQRAAIAATLIGSPSGDPLVARNPLPKLSRKDGRLTMRGRQYSHNCKEEAGKPNVRMVCRIGFHPS